MKSQLESLSLALIAISTIAGAASACERNYSHPGTQRNVSQLRSTRYVVFLNRPEADTRHHRSKRFEEPTLPPISVNAGVSYRMAGHQFGTSLGSVVLTTGGIEIPCDIHTWSAQEVTFQMPTIRLRRPTQAKLNIVSPSGDAIVSKAVVLRGLQTEVAQPTLEPLHQPNVPIHQSNVITQPSSIDHMDTTEAPLAPILDSIDNLDRL